MRRSRIDRDIRAAVVEYALSTGMNSPQILDALSKDSDYSGKRLPDVRSIQRIVKQNRSGDPAEVFNWRSYDSAEARDLLDVVAKVVSVQNDKELLRIFPAANYFPEGDFSKDIADGIVDVFGVAPGLNPLIVLQLAVFYVLCKKSGMSSSCFDLFLAYRAWESESNTAEWNKATLQDRWFPQRGQMTLLRQLKHIGIDISRTGLVLEPTDVVNREVTA